jgi:hypothetical protein
MPKKSDNYVIQSIEYGRYGPAIRICNGTVEAVIIPSISRVMHYSLVGEENVLWLDPPRKGRVDPDEWIGIGGSRIWLWPESEWELRTGRAWPPLPTYDEPSEAKIAPDGRTVVLRSPVHAAYGVRIVRSVRLEDRGTKLISTTRLVPEPGMKTQAAAPWEICKISPPEWGLARVSKLTEDDPGYKWLLRERDALTIGQWDAGYLQITEARADHVGKVGMNGDQLVAKRGKRLFAQRNLAASSGTYQPYARLQWYKSAKLALPKSSEKCFVELEHTAPVCLPTDDTPPLVVEWSILKLAEDQPSREDLEFHLSALSESVSRSMCPQYSSHHEVAGIPGGSTIPGNPSAHQKNPDFSGVSYRGDRIRTPNPSTKTRNLLGKMKHRRKSWC